MRFLTLFAGALVFLTSVCCCWQPADPIATVEAGSCGELEVKVSVSAGLARTLSVEKEDGGSIDVEVGFLQSEVVVNLPANGTTYVVVTDGGRSVHTPAPAVPTPTIAIAPVEPPAEGELATLRVTVQAEAECQFDGKVLVILRDGSGVMSDPSGTFSGRSLDLPVEGLHQGVCTADLTLWRTDGLRITQGEGSFSVRPPCVDADGDGVLACDGDCNDRDPTVRPGVRDTPGDGIDNDCDGVNGTDRDQDGHEAVEVGGDDCDDTDPYVHPGARPVDQDKDGYAVSASGADVNCDGRLDVLMGHGDDCDDTRADVHPGQAEPEIGNHVDDDCDGTVDEGTNLYDDDGDGQTEEEGDCDDADPRRLSGGRETYDCVDNDCNGEIDEDTKPQAVDDRFEPNDNQPAQLSTAKRNWIGGYEHTFDDVSLVSRDGQDRELFTIGAHDGLLDNFGVDVELVTGGQNIRYRVEIVAPTGRKVSEVLARPGELVSFAGTADHSDSGTYEIAIAPENSVLAWCPARFHIRSR